jgi:hypothetical protein
VNSCYRIFSAAGYGIYFALEGVETRNKQGNELVKKLGLV